MTTYVVAGGCFWCADAVFRLLKGVNESIVGYAGGSAETADYYQVAAGTTDHAEAVKVTFDETILPRETLLDIFFLIHDPTSLDKQRRRRRAAVPQRAILRHRQPEDRLSGGDQSRTVTLG